MPIVYVVGGGAVFFAGRDIHFGDASPAQQARCWSELGRLGFRRKRMLQVKSLDDAATATAVAAVEDKGAWVEAEQRVYGDAPRARARRAARARRRARAPLRRGSSAGD